ncbi:GntR family transcriptional regulator [Ligilactobacillus agilis]|uniref:GntR family transcriptional regulator n=1 Tax=Ligilactobacillus agilis TaxID=1601 RepID=UPI003D8013C2
MRKDSLYYDIYNKLRDDILSGNVPTDKKITEVGLSKELNVSRTPVRMAISKLKEEGLIKGKYVYIPTATDLRDISQVRILLEGYAANYCATYITEEKLAELAQCVEQGFHGTQEEQLHANYLFHQIIVEETRNAKLIQVIEQMQSYIRLLRLAVTIEGRPRLVAEHQEIYEAIKNGDGSKAEYLLKEHITKDLNFSLSKLRFLEQD